MAKEICVAPVEPIIVNNIATGVKRKAIFNTHALILFSEFYGDLIQVQQKYKNKPYQLASMFLYSAMKAADEDVEESEIEALVLGGGMDFVYTITMEAYENFKGLVDDEEVKKKLASILAIQKAAPVYRGKKRKR